jgi:hypothetical protein
MPRLEVDRERTLTFATTLINVPCSIIVNFKHRYKSIAITVGASYVAITCSDTVNCQTNTACVLTDYRALFKSVVDSID